MESSLQLTELSSDVLHSFDLRLESLSSFILSLSLVSIVLGLLSLLMESLLHGLELLLQSNYLLPSLAGFSFNFLFVLQFQISELVLLLELQGLQLPILLLDQLLSFGLHPLVHRGLDSSLIGLVIELRNRRLSDGLMVLVVHHLTDTRSLGSVHHDSHVVDLGGLLLNWAVLDSGRWLVVHQRILLGRWRSVVGKHGGRSVTVRVVQESVLRGMALGRHIA